MSTLRPDGSYITDGHFCQYRDIFGNPGEGAHKHRIFGLAAVDLFGTVLLAVLSTMIFGGNIAKNFILLIALAIVLHHIFCVDTALNMWLGL